MKVVGRFLAPDNKPLSGAISLTPSVPIISVADGQVLQTAVSAELDADGRVALEVVSPGEGVSPSSFSYRVRFALKHGGLSVPVKSFEVMAQDGTVDLKTVTPVSDPVTGLPVVAGSSVTGVELVDDELVFRMSDGKSFSTPLPASASGVPGRGVQSVVVEDGKLVFGFTDGTSQAVGMPADGADGVGVESASLEFSRWVEGGGEYRLDFHLTDGSTTSAGTFVIPEVRSIAQISLADESDSSTIRISLTDDTYRDFSLPAGVAGRGVQSITDVDGDGVATVTYTDGATSQLALPKPASAPAQDTGWRDITAQLGDDVANRHTPYGFKVLLRRVGDMVTLKFVGVVYKANATYQNFFALPDGFKNVYTENAAMFKAGTNLIGQSISVERSNVTVYSLNGVETYGSIRWLTNDVFPSYLPGVPA